MIKHAAAAAMILAMTLGDTAHAGLLSGLRDKLKGSDQPAAQPESPQLPPPAEGGQGQTPPKPTPSAEEIKKGAEKLKKELSWEKVPKDLFGKYAGKWNGHFWAYGTSGKKEQINRVSIEYAPQPDGTMTMTTLSFDMISNTWVTEETATYRVEGDRVIVDIRRPTGKTARQIGHFSDGQIFFEGQIDDGVEHFRERIDGQRLLVDGFGVYGSLKGNDKHVFIGRFLKAK